METGFFATLNQLLQSHPGWLVAMAFGFALLESLAIVGIFIPGIVLLFLIGAVVGTDLQLFLWCWISAAAGALAGDVISHWLGWRFRDQVPGMWPLSRRPDLLAAGRVAMESHGGKGIFIGRFVGPLRPIVPMVAGMMGLRLSHFVAFAIPACLLWAPAYLLPGMLFGASLELAAEFTGRLVILLLVVVLGLWLVIWGTRVVYAFTARRSGWWLKSLIRWSSDHPLVGRLVSPLFEPGRRELISVSLLGLLLLMSLAALLAVLVTTPFAAGTWDAERYLAGWAASLRSHYADPFFVAVALAADLRVMALLAAVVTLLLIALGRTNAAWHWLVATAGGWLLAEVLNGFMALIVETPEAMPLLGEVPHRPIALTTVVLGFFAVMLAKDISPRRRKGPYLVTTSLLALICFANFYLGRASISGIMAALALGVGWLSLVGIGYRQRALPGRHPAILAVMFYATLLIMAGVHVSAHHDSVLESSRLAQPLRVLEHADWLEDGWRELPGRRSRIGRAETQRFDFQYAGDLELLRQRLDNLGWQPSPEPERARLQALLPTRQEVSAMHHLPRDFAGRPEDLLLVYPGNDQRVFTLRLWSSGARLLPDQSPVWLGQVRAKHPGRFFGIFNRWNDVIEERPEALAQLLAALAGDERMATNGLWLIVLQDD